MNKLFLFLLLTGCCGLDTKPEKHIREPILMCSPRSPCSIEKSIKESLCDLLVLGHKVGFDHALIDITLNLGIQLTEEQKSRLLVSKEEDAKILHRTCMEKGK